MRQTITSTDTKIRAISRQLLETSLLLIFFIAPWFLGGRHPVGELVLILAVLPGVLGVTLRILNGGSLNLSTFAVAILLVVCLIPLLQIVPLPSNWIQDLTPGLSRLLNKWAEPLRPRDVAVRPPKVQTRTTKG